MTVMHLASRKGFTPVLILIAIAGIVVVVGIWYTSVLKIPVKGTILPVTPSASIPQYTMRPPQQSVTGTLPGLLTGPFDPASSTIIALVESSTRPLTSIVTDPNVRNDLRVDSFIKVIYLAPFDGKLTSAIVAARGKEYDVIVSNDYASSIQANPGQIIAMDVMGCALYENWPNFTCATKITVPPHWESLPAHLPVSWSGQNGATISLTSVALDAFPPSSTVSVVLNIKSGFGEFCPSSLNDYGLQVIVDERGHTAHPISLPSTLGGCIGPNRTTNQKVLWSLLTSSTPITIGIFDAAGNQQTFFSVNPLPNRVLEVIPAPASG
jgi:hypothetical protein